MLYYTFLMFYSGPFHSREDFTPYSRVILLRLSISLHIFTMFSIFLIILVSLVSPYSTLFAPFGPSKYPTQPSSTTYTSYFVSPLINFVIHLIPPHFFLPYHSIHNIKISIPVPRIPPIICFSVSVHHIFASFVYINIPTTIIISQ
jgi:hypothetical protein